MNHITKRQPMLSNLTELQDAINRLFDPTATLQDGLTNTLISDWIPTIDLKDEGTQFLIRVDVPGVESKDIDVSVDNNVLTIKGQRETKHKEETKKYVRFERSKGSFYRSITLPELVDASRLSAKTKNGVLEIVAPKNKNGTRKKVKVAK